MNEENYESGSCMYAAKKVALYLLDQGIGDFKIIEGWVSFPNIIKSQIWSQHTWVELKDGKIIDITKNQFKQFGVNPDEIIYHPTRRKEYYPEDYLDISNVEREVERDKPFRRYDERIINDYKAKYSSRLKKSKLISVSSSIKNILRNVYSKPLLTYLFKEIYKNPDIEKGQKGQLSNQQKELIKSILKNYFNQTINSVNEDIKVELKDVINRIDEVDINNDHLYILQNYGLILDFLTKVRPIQAWCGGFIECDEEYIYSLYSESVNRLNNSEEIKIDREEVQRILSRQFKLADERELLLPKFVDYNFLNFIEKNKENINFILNLGNSSEEELKDLKLKSGLERYRKSLLRNAIYLMDEDWINYTAGRLSVLCGNLSEKDLTNVFDFYNYFNNLKDSQDSKAKLMLVLRNEKDPVQKEFAQWLFVSRPKSTNEVYIYDIYIWAYYNNQIDNLQSMNIQDIYEKVLSWERRTLEYPPEKIEVYRKGIIPEWSDGNYKIINLHTSLDLIQEGDNLNHCVGRNHQEGVRAGTEEIYSLRDSSNKAICTMQYQPDSNDIYQSKMFSNATPTLFVSKLIEKWAKDNNIKHGTKNEIRITEENKNDAKKLETEDLYYYIANNYIEIDNAPELYAELLNRKDFKSYYFIDLLNHNLLRKDLVDKYGLSNRYEVLFNDLLDSSIKTENFNAGAVSFYGVDIKISLLYKGYIRPSHYRFDECYNEFKKYANDYVDRNCFLIKMSALTRNGHYAKYYYDLIYSLILNDTSDDIANALLLNGIVTRLDNNIIVNGKSINLFEECLNRFNYENSPKSFDSLMSKGSISRIDYGNEIGDKIFELFKLNKDKLSLLSTELLRNLLELIENDKDNYEEIFWTYLGRVILIGNAEYTLEHMRPSKYTREDISLVIKEKAKEDIDLISDIIKSHSYEDIGFNDLRKIIVSYKSDELLRLLYFCCIYGKGNIFPDSVFVNLLLENPPVSEKGIFNYTYLVLFKAEAIKSIIKDPSKIQEIINKCNVNNIKENGLITDFINKFGQYLDPKQNMQILLSLGSYNFLNTVSLLNKNNSKYLMNEVLLERFKDEAHKLKNNYEMGYSVDNFDNLIYITNMNNIVFENTDIYQSFCELLSKSLLYNEREGYYEIHDHFLEIVSKDEAELRINNNVNFLDNLGHIASRNNDDTIVLQLFCEFCENISDYFIIKQPTIGRQDLRRDMKYHDLNDIEEDVLNQLEAISIHKEKEEYDQIFSNKYKFYGLSNCIERIIENNLLDSVIETGKSNINILIGLLILDDAYIFLSNKKYKIYEEIKNILLERKGEQLGRILLNPENTINYVHKSLDSVGLSEEEDEIIKTSYPDLLLNPFMSEEQIDNVIKELIITKKIDLTKYHDRNGFLSRKINDYLSSSQEEVMKLFKEYISANYAASMAFPENLGILLGYLDDYHMLDLLDWIISNESFNAVQLYIYINEIIDRLNYGSDFRQHSDRISSILSKIDNEKLNSLLEITSKFRYQYDMALTSFLREIRKYREQEKANVQPEQSQNEQEQIKPETPTINISDMFPLPQENIY